MSYQQESLAAGATHVGEKGHGWRNVAGKWQVYKLGVGWVTENPETKLTELYNHTSEVIEPAPDHWLDVVQAHKAAGEALLAHERHFTHDTLCDLRLAFNRLSDLVELR